MGYRLEFTKELGELKNTTRMSKFYNYFQLQALFDKIFSENYYKSKSILLLLFPLNQGLSTRGVNGADSKRIMLILYLYSSFNERIWIQIRIVNGYQNLKSNPS